MRAARAAEDGKRAARNPEIYELRTIRMRIGDQPRIVHDFHGRVYVPLARKLGAGPVGAFNVTFGPEAPTLFVLTPHASMAAFERFGDRLAAELARASAGTDEAAAAARAYLAAPAHASPFVRIETQLLKAFSTFPALETPPGQPRVFELRVYESPTEAGHLKKMEMFTPKLGELEIFRSVGLSPVFFARGLTGPRLPSFTYMLVFPDLAAREAAWTTFRADPRWLKLKATPGYTDAEIMSGITSLILSPTDYSQV